MQNLGGYGTPYPLSYSGSGYINQNNRLVSGFGTTAGCCHTQTVLSICKAITWKRLVGDRREYHTVVTGQGPDIVSQRVSVDESEIHGTTLLLLAQAITEHELLITNDL